jgi:regulator of sirC expression with transglutaminase-like and TPR domain
LLFATGVFCADEEPAVPAADKAVERLADSARQSIVVITVTGRDGKRHGIGTGFVVAADGLIATNLHVIGEGRPFQVQFADRRNFKVTAVHASDRTLDLALLRIDAKDLTPLPLGDSDQLKLGQAVVALGNPRGLTHSVVSGVVSGKREIEGRPMIQLAVPIEQGNSGGPVLDLHGRVQGIVTMKSQVTANLGFAVPVNTLKSLLKKPNPVPMSRWLTIGALDPEEWTPVFEARWRRRGGVIQVEGAGSDVFGRALCLSKQPVPEPPYEVAVTVRLDDEDGAAGLAFHADGGDEHFGFYPSKGQLRLTHFQGPDVYSWKILKQESSRFYRPGEWNTLKVRVEKDRVKCFVNDQQVYDVAEADLAGGKVGLAKFRNTRAEFKNFRLARQLPPAAASPELVKRVTQAAERLRPDEPPAEDLVAGLVPDAPASTAALRDRARRLEQQAAQLRQLAVAVHQQRVHQELARLFRNKEEDVDLFQAALLVAKLDNEELEVEPYRKELERMAREVLAATPKNADAAAKRRALNKYLFGERGFHGSRSDYYNKSNSYLNEVIDDREGLPITLAVLYMEVARRVGLKVVGVPLPGHFVAKDVTTPDAEQLIDVYDGGKALSREEAEKKVEAITGQPPEEKHLAAATKRSILVRMLHNLLGIARTERDGPAMLRYLDAILVVAPGAAEERWLRAMLRYENGQRDGARADADWLLEHQPAGVPLAPVRELRQTLDGPGR